MGGARLSDYDYDLPDNLIARYPSDRRDGSRLLVVPQGDAPLRHVHFHDVADLFRPGDLLVVNESRVRPARLLGTRPGGGAAEILLLRPADEDERVWDALVRPGSKLKPGRRVEISPDVHVEIVGPAPGGGRMVRIDSDRSVDDVLSTYGHMPLPPYIDRPAEASDRERYQTVYACVPGSVAAPTAGLHFTHDLLARLEAGGVRRVPVTLHVGVGTFRPIMVDDPRDHEMHHETYTVSAETADAVNATRARGGRIWAVGTTAVRTLESVARDGTVRAGVGVTDLFVRPPYRFQVVDCLLTNFHLPRSTLMMLVAAFAGYSRTIDAYAEAIGHGYRFYSYGDAMALVGRSAAPDS